MKLSKVQSETLGKMRGDKWYTAYDLGVRLSTLYALADRNLLEYRKELGFIYSPRTSIFFRRTDGEGW